MAIEEIIGRMITDPMKRREKTDNNILTLFDIKNSNISEDDRAKIQAFFQIVGRGIKRLDQRTRERIPRQLELLSTPTGDPQLDRDADTTIVKFLLKSLYSAYILLGEDPETDKSSTEESTAAVKALVELRKTELLGNNSKYNDEIKKYLESD